MSVREGYKETEIGVIPVDWEVVKLGEVCDVRDGTHDSPKYQESGVPFITSKHLTNQGIDFTEANHISQSDHLNFSKRSLVENGDILFGMIGTIGKPLIVNYDFEFSIKNVALLKFVDNTQLLNVFTLNLLKSKMIDKQFSKLGNGGVQSFIALGMIRSLKIPLPPLKEQDKIADILTTADDKIEAIASQIQKAETLKKGLLQKLLSEGIGHTEFKDSELGRIPVGWEVLPLSSVCRKIIGGGTPSKEIAEYWVQGTIPWATVKDMDNSKYLHTAQDFITTIGLDNSSANLIPANSIITATRMGIGRFFINTVDMAINQDLKALIVDEKHHQDFVFWSLLSKSEMLESMGTGTTVKGIKLEELRKVKFAIPPLTEQKQIATILSTADEKLEVLRAKKEKYETLKQGLMQKLLTGEVRV